MRGIHILAVAVIVNFLPAVSVAQDYEDCRSKCVSERDTRNMDCPSPYDIPEFSEERSKCLKASQDVYADCVRQCPAPPPPSSGGQTPPSSMGY